MSEPSAAGAVAPGAALPVDLGRFNRLTDGDAEFAHDLATTFTASGNQQLTDINAALAAADRLALARAAHKLKGACANIYAQPLCDLAARLESTAPGAELADLIQLSAALRAEFARTSEYLLSSLPAPLESARDR